MVKSVIEPFEVDIIKVTIKDKPGLPKLETESLSIAFKALKQYAQQERLIRQLKNRISEKNSQRRLARYFDLWHNRVISMRKMSESIKLESPLSKDKKIEQLVNIIAEKQKENITTLTLETSTNSKVKRKSKSASVNKSGKQINEKKRAASCEATKPKQGYPNYGYKAQNRLEAQKLIIQEQKAKLAEQNKFIQDMKLKEIDKEAKCTNKQTIDVAKQALNQCDKRTRRSIIHLMREQGCRYIKTKFLFRDESITEIPQIQNPPKFLKRMEERAEARKQKMKETYETRRQRLAEQKRKDEIVRKEAEEQQRQQQLQALKEAQKLRREQENRRLKEINKYKKLEQIADDFYKKYLFRRYVFGPITNLIEQKYNCMKKADEHYRETLLIKIFSAWKNEWIDQQEKRLQLANRFYRYNLLSYAFEDWKSFALDMKQKYQVAVDFYDIKLQTKCLREWHELCIKIKIVLNIKEVKALNLHELHLKRKFFKLWRQFMTIADDIKEREDRRDEWRDLIRKFIPDNK